MLNVNPIPPRSIPCVERSLVRSLFSCNRFRHIQRRWLLLCLWLHLRWFRPYRLSLKSCLPPGLRLLLADGMDRAAFRHERLHGRERARVIGLVRYRGLNFGAVRVENHHRHPLSLKGRSVNCPHTKVGVAKDFRERIVFCRILNLALFDRAGNVAAVSWTIGVNIADQRAVRVF